jgi:magnesium and cobalt transporter
MEDLLECIFGDIPSPSDITEQFEIKQLEDGRYQIDASMPLDDFDEHFTAAFERQEVETIGGLVLNEFGELPSEGDVIVIDGFKFTVSSVAQNRIAKLLLELLPTNEKSEAEEPAEETRDSLETPESPER